MKPSVRDIEAGQSELFLPLYSQVARAAGGLLLLHEAFCGFLAMTLELGDLNCRQTDLQQCGAALCPQNEKKKEKKKLHLIIYF